MLDGWPASVLVRGIVSTCGSEDMEESVEACVCSSYWALVFVNDMVCERVIVTSSSQLQ